MISNYEKYSDSHSVGYAHNESQERPNSALTRDDKYNNPY